MLKTEEWYKLLQKNGYRITQPRRAVVDTIIKSNRGLAPFEIFEQARKKYPEIGLVTVYRTLEKLDELGLVQRIHHPSGCQAFIAAFTGHQHMLICNQCGQVEFFDGDQEKIETFSREISQNSNFKIDSHWLQFFGTCAECQK